MPLWASEDILMFKVRVENRNEIYADWKLYKVMRSMKKIGISDDEFTAISTKNVDI